MSKQSLREEVVIKLMKQVCLFQSFSRQDVESVLKLASRLDVDEQERIIEQGEQGDSMYVILAGEAAVMARHEEADEYHVADLGPGDSFGELCLLDAWPRSASVVAKTPMHLLEFNRNGLLKIQEIVPKIYYNIAYLLGNRLRHSNETVSLILDKSIVLDWSGLSDGKDGKASDSKPGEPPVP